MQASLRPSGVFVPDVAVAPPADPADPVAEAVADAYPPPLIDRGLVFALHRVHAVAAVGVMVLTAGVLAGWLVGAPQTVPAMLGLSWGLMKFNAALGMLLAAIALWLCRSMAAPWRRRLVHSLGFAVAALAAASLAEDVFGWELGIDELIVADRTPAPTVVPGRMSANAALSLIGIGLALVCIDRDSRGGERPAEWLAMAATLPAFLAIFGHAYSVPEIAGLFHSMPMPILTVVTVFALVAGILAARPESGSVRWLVTRSPEGDAARLLLPGSILLIVVVGLVAAWGRQLGWYDSRTSNALILVLAIGALFFVLTRAVAWLVRAEARRRAVVDELSVREAKLRYVTDAADIGDWDWDLRSDRLEFSPRCRAIFGILPDEPMSYARFVAALHPDDREASESAVRAAWSGMGSYDIEFRVCWPDGSEHWVHAKGRASFADGQAVRMGGIAFDISAHKLAEARLKESENRFRTLADTAPAMLWVSDATGQESFISQGWYDFTGQPRAAGLGLGWLAALHPDDREVTRSEIGAALAGQREFACEFRVRHADGGWRWVLDRGRPRFENGSFAGFVGSIIDITERKEAEDGIRRTALHDPLSGLPNRALIFEYGNHLLAAAERAGCRAALLFIDLDRFKPINDTYGHKAGDHVLKETARRLARCTRQADLVGRLGGDEFVIVLGHLDATTQRELVVAQHVLDCVSQPIAYGMEMLSVTPSIGISRYPEHGHDIETLLRSADVAMYQAKQSGRANFHVYTHDLDRRAEEAQALEKRIRQALSHGGLELHYQPIVDIDSGRLAGAEALVRLHDEGGGTVGPARLIPVAESSGLINEVGEWVAAEACRQQQAWCSQGLPPLPLSINVSPLQFREQGFAERLGGIVAASGIDPACLQVELTESTVMERVDEAIAILQRIRSFGIGVALDDFGTDASSLSLLGRLPVDKLKINQSFVQRHESQAIAQAIIALGQKLHLVLVGERVESDGMLERLHSSGCQQAQGFFISQPLPAAEFARWQMAH